MTENVTSVMHGSDKECCYVDPWLPAELIIAIIQYLPLYDLLFSAYLTNYPCKALNMLGMCTTYVNSVHCAEIVYLPTINWLQIPLNSEMCSFVLFMSVSFGLLVVVIIDTMKLRT